MNIPNKLPWPDWEIVRRLGGGSYGTVYEIRRERYGIVERAAMKVISFPKDAEEVEDQRRSGFTDESLVNSYRQQMQRFLDEYRLMLELKGKTNIVSCDDFQTVPHADGIGWDIFIKMELLTPLKKYLAREITPEQTVKLGIDLCKALSLCREKDIIHRDIKPDNILVSDSGDFKLGDFGVAKTAERTMAGTRTGTPNFTAPEVYHNEPYGKSVDIYSLGMVLYWMLNRRALPFLPLPPQMPSSDEMQDALLRRMRGEALPRPADGSRALQDVVLKACAYRPEDRYATPEDFLRALKAVYTADTSAADTIPDAQPAAPAAEPSSTDADATMGNNWETGPQTETQPELTDFDATDATMGTCGTLPASHAEPEPAPEPPAPPVNGSDLYREVTVTPKQAADGCKITVVGYKKAKLDVTIPPCSQNGKQLRCTGQGYPGLNGGKNGDLYITVQIRAAEWANMHAAPRNAESSAKDESSSKKVAAEGRIYIAILGAASAIGCSTFVDNSRVAPLLMLLIGVVGGLVGKWIIHPFCLERDSDKKPNKAALNICLIGATIGLLSIGASQLIPSDVLDGMPDAIFLIPVGVTLLSGLTARILFFEKRKEE